MAGGQEQNHSNKYFCRRTIFFCAEWYFKLAEEQLQNHLNNKGILTVERQLKWPEGKNKITQTNTFVEGQ